MSLFTGCGLLDLGLERAGWLPVLFCEQDQHCQRILAQHWPDVPVVGDVRQVAADTDSTGREGRQHAAGSVAGCGGSDEPSVDLVVGGFPCQPVSYAGKRQAQSDDRWLWPEMARVIRAVRPRLVLVENVPGLATAGLGLVLGDLAEAGYDTEWLRVRASDVGAPHRRERLFIVAADSEGHEQRQPPIAYHGVGIGVRPEPGRNGKGALDDTDGDGARGNAGTSYQGEGGGGHRSGINGVVVDGETGSRIGQVDKQAPADTADDGLARTGRAWSGRAGLANGRPDVAWGAYEPAIRRWETVMGLAPAPTDEKGRLAPGFVEWMMGAPDGWTEGVSRTQRLKMLGNGVQVQVGTLLGEALRGLNVW